MTEDDLTADDLAGDDLSSDGRTADGRTSDGRTPDGRSHHGRVPDPDRNRRFGGDLPEHEVRTALLALLAEFGTVTATEAASQLGYSSGLCSFHLRQLARHGHIEEAPHHGGRARPWRLKRPDTTAEATAHGTTGASTGAAADPVSASGDPTFGDSAFGDSAFGDLARGLEDESWQRWLAQRDRAPSDWRQDAAFSAVAYLTPEELNRVADTIRQALAPYQDREQRPLARPAGARPVALISRLFPLLPHPTDGGEGTEGADHG